jgi:RNA polymerase sigma factor (TIGR02999 family)
MNSITGLLDAASRGDPAAAAELLPLVYAELRRLAASRLAHEPPGHTLDATALVHEAYLRLVGNHSFDHRGHFFIAAAEAMRRILVESARRKKAALRSLAVDARERMRLLSPSDAQVYFWRAAARAWELVGEDFDVELVEESSKPDAVFEVNVNVRGLE